MAAALLKVGISTRTFIASQAKLENYDEVNDQLARTRVR